MTTRTRTRKKAKEATVSRRKKAATPPRAGARRAPPSPIERLTRGGPGGPPATEARVSVDIDAVLVSVSASRDALVVVQAKLNAISEAALDKLPQEDQEAWADSLAQTNNAITRLDTVALKVINEDFAARVPELERSTKALAASLQKMKDVADIVASIAKVIQIVTEIAALIK